MHMLHQYYLGIDLTSAALKGIGNAVLALACFRGRGRLQNLLLRGVQAVLEGIVVIKLVDIQRRSTQRVSSVIGACATVVTSLAL